MTSPPPPSGPPSVPPSGPPTGPPSGPLSGAATRPGTSGPPPPPAPPHDGSGGGGGGGGSGGGDGPGPGGGKGGRSPWWRSVPKVASVTALVVAAAALSVVLIGRSGDKGDTAGSGGGEVFLQNTSASGPDPFTASTARTDGSSASASLPSRSGTAGTGTPQVSGATPGLYGGTRAVASCDVEKQVRYLAAEPAKNAAFGSVLGLGANEVPGYLRSLTPLQLRADTRVTNHGYRDGSPTAYQAVLQAGTAVLVDGRGVPRVRCACGNPLTEPVAQKNPRTEGAAWTGYDSSQVVVVAPATTVVNVFVVYDPDQESWFARKPGDTGRHDKPTPPPPRPTPTASCPSGGTTPCPTPSDSSPTPSESSSSPAPSPSTAPTPTTSSPAPSDSTPAPTTVPPSSGAPSSDSAPASPGSPSDGSPSDGPGTTTEGTPAGTTTTAGAATDASAEPAGASGGAPAHGPGRQPVA
ncbi:DUF6777 domain-containing protein [Streptomyces termitum]|uniref:DUF6777 domain-containing protein n=1 Tax=Streptomyces termitum TaxID=67368 RepID=UPI0037BC434F